MIRKDFDGLMRKDFNGTICKNFDEFISFFKTCQPFIKNFVTLYSTNIFEKVLYSVFLRELIMKIR